MDSFRHERRAAAWRARARLLLMLRSAAHPLRNRLGERWARAPAPESRVRRARDRTADRRSCRGGSAGDERRRGSRPLLPYQPEMPGPARAGSSPSLPIGLREGFSSRPAMRLSRLRAARPGSRTWMDQRRISSSCSFRTRSCRFSAPVPPHRGGTLSSSCRRGGRTGPGPSRGRSRRLDQPAVLEPVVVRSGPRSSRTGRACAADPGPLHGEHAGQVRSDRSRDPIRGLEPLDLGPGLG